MRIGDNPDLTCCQTGINYIAQVLKRNRTLKVLNLSENKLDVQGLVAVAEALVRIKPSRRVDLLTEPAQRRNITRALRLLI